MSDETLFRDVVIETKLLFLGGQITAETYYEIQFSRPNRPEKVSAQFVFCMEKVVNHG